MKNLLISVMFSAIAYSSAFGMGSPAEEQISLGSAIPAFLAASGGETATEKSTLHLADQSCLVKLGKDIDANVAKQSQTMKEMIEDIGLSEDALHLNCTKKGFALILPLMQLQHNYLISSEALLEEPAKSKEILQQKIKRVLIDSATNDLMQIVVVANYLNIQPTFDIARKMLGERLMSLANIEAVLACPFIKELNDIPDIRKLLINYFWKKSEAFSFWIEHASKLKASVKTFGEYSEASEYFVNFIHLTSVVWIPPYLVFPSFGLNKDETKIASGSWNNTIKIWDVTTGRCLQTLSGHRSFVRSVAWNVDGTRIISGSADGTIKIWDAHTGICLQTLSGHRGSVNSVALTKDGTRIISGSNDGTIKIWDTRTGECLRTLSGHKHSVESIALGPDEIKIVSGSSDGTIRIWDAHTGKYLCGHEFTVYSVAWSADGTKIASCSWDNTIKIWDAVTGLCLQTLSGHRGSVNSVALTKDGTRIVSGSADGTMKIWDVHTGRCLQTLFDHKRSIGLVAWNGDETKIITGSNDGIIKIWDVNIKLLNLQQSMSLQHALLLMYAYDCKIKNKPLSLGVYKLSETFRHLPHDLPETILQTSKSTCFPYITLELVDLLLIMTICYLYR